MSKSQAKRRMEASLFHLGCKIHCLSTTTTKIKHVAPQANMVLRSSDNQNERETELHISRYLVL